MISGAILVALIVSVVAQTPIIFSTIEPSLTAIQAAAATAQVGELTSDVQGAAFTRFIQIWLENTDYTSAFEDPSLQTLAEQGITLTNYWANTHVSEPNYISVVGGDYFGLNGDNFERLPENVSTVVDLLETKRISWAEYQEDLPYAGFQGFNYSNQKTFANDYVRKHNPLVVYDSITNNASRLSNIKNFTSFYDDVQHHHLPQWSFMTPNMTNDGHDTNVTFTGKWALDFLQPLLSNQYFTSDTLILVTFDENETKAIGNRVFALLLGGAVPKHLHGTTDSTFYSHYSCISSVSRNWRLPSLGRNDVGANIFELVAEATGYHNKAVNTTGYYANFSIPGYLNSNKWAPIPVPITTGNVLQSVKDTWGNSTAQTPYNADSAVPYDGYGAQVADSNPGTQHGCYASL
ncbi:phosphoesterase family-domain-containing protein [Lipomyces kononenkoae]|uniref:Phosphoesterase family-domain-containing protein n=1 Tax=Lipomyces kononenkoae TaxID=34357 RepID=A0ACC3SYZ7_LIPKO